MKAKVGDVVYKAFQPAVVGVVVRIEPSETVAPYAGMSPVPTGPIVVIRTLNGDERRFSMLEARLFEDLVEDHRRKYERHAATLKKICEAT